MDLAAYCMENPGIVASYTTGPGSVGANCRNTTIVTEGGNVNLSHSGTASCGGDGTLTFGSASAGGVIATLSTVSDFQARCYAANQSIRCTVEAR